MPAERDEGSAFATTVNRTEPSPWPSTGDASVTHAASLLADHGHSRLVEMRRVPDPPDGGKEEPSAFTCTPHFVVEGAVRVLVCEDEPQDVERSAAAVVAITARSLKDEPERATVCTGPRFGDRS
jgi:hypothetical protein